MTRKEFDEWFGFHRKMFPQLGEWFIENAENGDLILNEWAAALKRTRVQDAMQCTRKMIAGEIEHPNRFEVASLPGLVCRSCPRQPVPFSELAGKTYNPSTGEVT